MNIHEIKFVSVYNITFQVWNQALIQCTSVCRQIGQAIMNANTNNNKTNILRTVLVTFSVVLV